MNDDPEAPEAASEMPRPRLSLESELREVINRNSAENGSDTPDFILAQYLIGCLNLLDTIVRQREAWYGRAPSPSRLPPPGSMT